MTPSPVLSNAYLLNGLAIPRPKFFKRDFIFVSKDVRAINGKEGRDISGKKERFVLGWELLALLEFDRLSAAADTGTAVTFSVTDGNLVINQTNVLARLSQARYIVPGSNYVVGTEIELTEVE